jgi:hypothetical protein
LLANKGVPFAPALWRLLPAHVELLLVGWTVQLAFAVTHWIIPRFRGGRFGQVLLARLSLLFLNAGVILVVVGSLVPLQTVAFTIGRILEAASVILFALYIWSRIRPSGQ